MQAEHFLNQDHCHPAELSSDRLLMEHMSFIEGVRTHGREDLWRHIHIGLLDDLFMARLREFTLPEIKKFIRINRRKLNKSDRKILYWSLSPRTDNNAQLQLNRRVDLRNLPG